MGIFDLLFNNKESEHAHQSTPVPKPKPIDVPVSNPIDIPESIFAEEFVNELEENIDTNNVEHEEEEVEISESSETELDEEVAEIELEEETEETEESVIENNEPIINSIFKGDNMSRDHGNGCECHANLCNDLAYLFGRNDCVTHSGIPLKTVGDTIIGYAVNKGKLHEIKIVWKGNKDTRELLAITKDGEEIEWVMIEGESGTKCVTVDEKYCDCEVINVVEKALGTPPQGGEVGEFNPPCAITVALWYTPECDIRVTPEGDGVAEAVDTTGTTPVVAGATWYVRTLDFERNNTIPSFATFIDAEDAYELKWGMYIIAYQSGIDFDKSVNVRYDIKLQHNINGGGWVDLPQSGAYDFNLSGDDGTVAAGRTITYRVNQGDTVKIRMIEKISDDTSLQNASGGAGIVIERIANGSKIC